MREQIIEQSVEELVKYLQANGPLSGLDIAMIRLVITQVYTEAQFEMLEKTNESLKKLL